MLAGTMGSGDTSSVAPPTGASLNSGVPSAAAVGKAISLEGITLDSLQDGLARWQRGPSHAPGATGVAG
eukprot:CAMPEP_0179365170 /NCGR_PEP_ID=MMETSP0797-20121207/82414_1 /TAXON_ID=47934 /ORGANISM="Dinophysis acuminata, Strain DAEP01" /LENGTH=68 /DNA_ID=CAMNT_0021080667 /DNA_START=100 /DNA_END=302 /DNA_ORIENTATION=-